MIQYINNKFVWRRNTTEGMGKIFANIELLNAIDMHDARRNRIGEDEIKGISICPQVDTGSDELCINENIQEVLQIPVMGTRRVQLADGSVVRCDVVSPIELKFENCRCICDALVLPGDAEPLLGLFPLESLHVIIDPDRMQLIENPDLRRI